MLFEIVTYLLFIASRNPSNTDCILKLREETKTFTISFSLNQRIDNGLRRFHSDN